MKSEEEMVQQIDGPIPTELIKPRRALSIVLAFFWIFYINIFCLRKRNNIYLVL